MVDNMKPKLLDLYCGAGGASMGYYRARFEVEGVDNKPQPHYPFKFYLADALAFPLEGYDAYHASPPCQAYTVAISSLVGKRGEHPDLLGVTRDYLLTTGKPFVIENVPRSPMFNYIELDGTMFGLKTIKRRLFELHGFEILLLPCPFNARGKVKSGEFVGIYDHKGKERSRRQDLEEAYEMEWGCTRHELRQAIPPAYTEYIGKYLMQSIMRLE